MLSTPRLAAVAAAIFVSGLSASATAQTQNFTVDCTRGQTISNALQRGDSRKPLVLAVRGTCNENVVIDRDDVRLQGRSSGDGVTGLDTTKDTILVEGARRVAFENLTVSGGGNGIAFVQGASGMVDSCTVQNTGVHGVRIEGASATVVNSTISFNHLAGIMLENGGNGRIGITNSNQYEGNTINSNGGDGIHVQYGATAAIGGITITGNGTDPNDLDGQPYECNLYDWYNLEEGQPIIGPFDLDSGDIFVNWRIYVEPATNVGPDDNELLYDRAIYFGPYFTEP